MVSRAATILWARSLVLAATTVLLVVAVGLAGPAHASAPPAGPGVVSGATAVSAPLALGPAGSGGSAVVAPRPAGYDDPSDSARGAGSRVFSGSSAGFVATNAGGRARDLTYGDPGPGSMGSTDPYGNITIRPGLSADDFGETLRHETVHAVLSPRRGPFLDTRARIGATGYDRSHALRFIEETAAETYATGSLRQGVNLALDPSYRVSLPRVGLEVAAYVGVTGAAAYGAHEWMND